LGQGGKQTGALPLCNRRFNILKNEVFGFKYLCFAALQVVIKATMQIKTVTLRKATATSGDWATASTNL
jgi:hypothetical protein